MKQLLGTGILNWNRSERVSDRYGSVMLTRDAMVSPLGGDLGYVELETHEHLGKRGTLVAIVRQNRASPHIGDLFRGLRPPDEPLPINTEVNLGTGTLFEEENDEGGWCVGLKPDDKRTNDWLDPKVLYQLHNQTVDLFFDSEEEPT